jgi:hypothetical protein
MRTQGGVPAQLGVLPRGWAAGCCEPQGVVQKGGGIEGYTGLRPVL